MDDMSESSDTLHAFNVYKPSYAEIRWSTNWSTKIQHIYKFYSYISERSTIKPALYRVQGGCTSAQHNYF